MKCLIGSNTGGAKCGVKGSLSKLVQTYHVDEGVREGAARGAIRLYP